MPLRQRMLPYSDINAPKAGVDGSEPGCPLSVLVMSPWCHLFGTPLTTFFSHELYYKMAGKCALRLLFNQIDGKTEVEEVHIPSLLEIRKSGQDDRQGALWGRRLLTRTTWI